MRAISADVFLLKEKRLFEAEEALLGIENLQYNYAFLAVTVAQATTGCATTT